MYLTDSSRALVLSLESPLEQVSATHRNHEKTCSSRFPPICYSLLRTVARSVWHEIGANLSHWVDPAGRRAGPSP